MLIALSTAAIISFLFHVGLLIAAFASGRYNSVRYLYSHVTLWIAGLLVFIMALLYQGTGESVLLDYFDTPVKKAMILVVTFALSLVAHGVVKLWVMPAAKGTTK